MDDHALVRAGFRRLVDESEDFTVVGEAGDAAAAIECACELQPDIVLLDISLPDRSGIEAIGSIHAGAPGCRIVMLSQYQTVQFVEAALRAGAVGYLLKTSTSEQLTAGLRAAIRCEDRLPPEMAGQIVRSFGSPDGAAGRRARLTARETEVLRRVAEGLSSKQIAAELNISPRTAEAHRANVMNKLDLHGVADLVRFAIREGLLAP